MEYEFPWEAFLIIKYVVRKSNRLNLNPGTFMKIMKMRKRKYVTISFSDEEAKTLHKDIIGNTPSGKDNNACQIAYDILFGDIVYPIPKHICSRKSDYVNLNRAILEFDAHTEDD